jgi:hypothetical protein
MSNCAANDCCVERGLSKQPASLDVRILEARCLPDANFLSKPSFYAILTYNRVELARTAVQKHTTDPVWDQLFTIDNVLSDGVPTDSAQVGVIVMEKKAILADAEVGRYELSLAGLSEGEVQDRWLLLRSPASAPSVAWRSSSATEGMWVRRTRRHSNRQTSREGSLKRRNQIFLDFRHLFVSPHAAKGLLFFFIRSSPPPPNSFAFLHSLSLQLSLSARYSFFLLCVPVGMKLLVGVATLSLCFALVVGAQTTCSAINTSFVSQAVLDGVLACPAMGECVAAACGNLSGTMKQSSCADYDSACLRQAAACFFRQLTNGTRIDPAAPFCSSWMTNATKLLSSNAAKRRGACMQMACGALGQYGYGAGTLCTSNTSRSALTDDQWNAACDFEPSPGGLVVPMYIALPVCIHTIMLLIFMVIVYIGFSEDEDEDKLLIIMVDLPVLIIVIFFAGFGIAGLVHRPLYGGTVDCNALSASAALENELSGTASLANFFSNCDNDQIEIAGYKGAVSAQKCCIPRPRRNTSFECNSIAIIPNLLDNPMLVTDDVQRGAYARCCPTIGKETVPVGFAAMAVSAVIGIVVNVVLNILSMKVFPKLKAFCCSSSTTTEVSDVQTEADAQEEQQTPEATTTAAHQFLGVCLQPSGFGILKLFVSFVLNIISAAATSNKSAGDSWSRYCVFVSAMVNGSFVANFSDFLCTMLVYELSEMNETAHSKDKENVEEVKDIIETFGEASVMLIFIIFLPIIVTHWIPGVIIFLPWVAAFALLAAVLVVVIAVPLSQGTEVFADGDDVPVYIIVLYAIAVFALCLVFNMIFVQGVRFPVNWALMLYGETPYPYFVARPDASTTTQLADFYAAMFNTPFYFMQMSSQSCSLLKSAESAFAQMNNVMMYI